MTMLRWLRQFGIGLTPVALCLVSVAQQPKPTSTPQAQIELPVELLQKVVAGGTAVGTPVRAKLTIATLINGVVVPDGAVITGKVEESVAKGPATLSRLKIKFESAHWKTGDTTLALFLAGSYYPIELGTVRDEQSGMHGEAGVTMGGMPSNVTRTPTGVPTADASGNNDGFPDPQANAPAAEISKHWVRIKGVDTSVGADGSLEITSKERNLKLDKGVIYSAQSAMTPPAK